ncbi:hypothetical protein GCM10028817_00030 [Spirosoma pomorum]|jgi:ABC-type dipeptide/oligopeptide/nickel transport system permease component
MSIWRNKNFYIRTLITFVVIVFIDWLIESGYKLFQGQNFTQTIEHYKIPFTYLAIAGAIVYSNLKRKEES